MPAVAASVLLAVLVGAAARRLGGAAVQPVARVALVGLLYVLLPVVIFVNLTRLQLSGAFGLSVLAGWIALALTGLAAWAIARHGLRLAPPEVGAVVVTAMQGNTGYLGLPLCGALLGAGALPEAAAYDSLVQVPILITVVFAVAARLGTQSAAPSRRRRAPPSPATRR